MREKIASGSDYLKNIYERPCIKRFDKCLNFFEIQYGINPRPYLETLVIGIL